MVSRAMMYDAHRWKQSRMSETVTQEANLRLVFKITQKLTTGQENLTNKDDERQQVRLKNHHSDTEMKD